MVRRIGQRGTKIQAWVTGELREKVDETARRRGLTRAAVIRRALVGYLQREATQDRQPAQGDETS